MDSTPTNVNDSLIQRMNVAKDSTPINVNNSVTVPDQEVGHLSWDRDFCELKQQIWGIYGLVWWTSVLWRQCTTLAILEYVIFVLWIFSPVGHQMAKNPEVGHPWESHCRLAPLLQNAILNHWGYYCTSSFESGDLLVWKWIIIWCFKMYNGEMAQLWCCGPAWNSPQAQTFSVMLYPIF